MVENPFWGLLGFLLCTKTTFKCIVMFYFVNWQGFFDTLQWSVTSSMKMWNACIAHAENVKESIFLRPVVMMLFAVVTCFLLWLLHLFLPCLLLRAKGAKAFLYCDKPRAPSLKLRAQLFTLFYALVFLAFLSCSKLFKKRG